jgi:hypothetical protein
MSKSPSWIVVAACATFGVAWLVGCDGGSGGTSGPLPAPTFVTLTIPNPDGSNNWVGMGLTPTPEVLPTRGRAVRVSCRAPIGSAFSVGLRTPDGTLTPLPENSGPAPTALEAGFFNIVSVDTSVNPPLYVIYTRAPATVLTAASYDIEVVNKSQNTNRTDSPPLFVPLLPRKDFRIVVTVNGNGHVESTPQGIQCGTTPNGSTLSQCSAEFAAGNVSLAPGSNDLNTTRFIGWSGNCAANVQVCQLSVTGTGPLAAIANFGATNVQSPPSTCATPPVVMGFRWIDLPDCATGNIAGHPGISHPALCDAQGYFCCEPGPPNANAPRCGGTAQIESRPDCMRNAPRGLLIQPGGCYESDP